MRFTMRGMQTHNNTETLGGRTLYLRKPSCEFALHHLSSLDFDSVSNEGSLLFANHHFAIQLSSLDFDSVSNEGSLLFANHHECHIRSYCFLCGERLSLPSSSVPHCAARLTHQPGETLRKYCTSSGERQGHLWPQVLWWINNQTNTKIDLQAASDS